MLIFVSYHTPDRPKAQAMMAALAARRPGNEFYLAPRNIAGGAYWLPAIADAIARCDAVLFLVGKRIGPWQELEYYEALRLTRERSGRLRLIPVVIDDQAPGLPFFAQLHQIFAEDVAAAATLQAIERALEDSLPPETDPAWRRFQPYKGLPALDEADAAFFFGRDTETAAILDLLARRTDRIIAMIGGSGIGKSSLARAGVLARLKSQLWPESGGAWPAGLRDSRAYLTLVVRPGEQPLKEIALAFAQLYCTRSFELDEEAQGWARRFAAGARLQDMLRATRDKLAEALGAEPPRRFVVYLDQGEELYTRGSREERSCFSSLIAEAAGHEAFSVLMSLRNDYYPAYQDDRAIFAASERVDLLPMTRDVLGEIVRKPALTLGVRFESQQMVEHIADATAREPGALPLLSDLMHEMWLHMQARGDGVLRWSDNPGIVDVASPLRRRAEAFLEDPAHDERVLRRLFTLRLTHVPEVGEAVRRPARRSECSEAEWALAEELADQEQRLLILTRTADGESAVEVAHEQLLRRWPRLKAWLDEEREFLVWKGQVEQSAKAYAALPETERAGALLMGRPLAVARGWFERRADDLPPDLRDYVARSMARHDELEAEQAATEQRLREAELRGEREARQRAEEAKASAVRLARRTRIGAFAALSLFLVAAVVGVYAVRAEDKAQEELKQTLIARSRLLAAESQQQLRSGNAGTALALALEALPTEDSSAPGIPEAEGAALSALFALKEMAVLSGHEDVVEGAAFSPDGNRIVTAAEDDTVRVWHAASGKELLRFRGNDKMFGAAYSPDGRSILTASGDDTVVLRDANDGSVITTFPHAGSSARFSSDGSRIITTSVDGSASIWDVASKSLVKRQVVGTDPLLSGEFSRDGRLFATSSKSGSVAVWDATTYSQKAQFACAGRSHQVSFSPDGKTILAACGSPKPGAHIWNLETGKETLLPHDDAVGSAAFDSDGSRIVTASFDGVARIWNVARGEQVAAIRGHAGALFWAAFSPDGRRIVTTSVDRTARVWSIEGERKPVTLGTQQASIYGAEFNADGSHVVTAEQDGWVRIWDVVSRQVLTSFAAGEQGRSVVRAALSSDGNRLMTIGADGHARIWNAATGEKMFELAHDKPVWSARFDQADKRVITAVDDGSVHIWDVTSGKELRVLRGPGGPAAMYAAFDADGNRAVIAVGGTAEIWDVAAGERKLVIHHDSLVHRAVFSPDGRRVITAAGDGTVDIWDAASGEMQAALVGHQSQVTAVAISPDGRRIVTASLDRTARVWDVDTGHELFRAEGHDRLYDAAFSPDGHRIVIASLDGTAQIWPVPGGAGGEIVEQALHAAPRCLAPQERAHFFLPSEPPAWCHQMQKWPYDAGTYEARGLEELRYHHNDQAVAELAEALRLDPSRRQRIGSALADAYNGRAWQDFLQAHYSSGLTDAERAVELAPENPAILDTRGEIYFALGRYDDAFADLSKAVENGGNDPITYFTLGRIHERRGNREQAIVEYRKAVELKSDDDANRKAQGEAQQRLTALGALARGS